MFNTAQRIHTVEEYYFSKKLKEVAKKRADGDDILNLAIGSPDLPPAPEVITALADTAHQSNAHGYQSYNGIAPLRAAFAMWYKRMYNVQLSPDNEILPLMGSKEGIMHIAMTYLQPGDEALVPNPGYPAYRAATQLAGGRAVAYDLNEANNWLPDLAALEKNDLSCVKVMWVNYPHMPTGGRADIHFFQALISFAEKHQILLCNDNPYSLILNDQPLSIFNAGKTENILELNSLSKSHNMAGWRVGMLAGSAKRIQEVLTFKSNMDSGMFLGIQQAAIAALDLSEEWYSRLNQTYHERKAHASAIMDALGCTYTNHQVGMFIWGKAPDNIINIPEWIDEILERTHVFIAPGNIFGSNGERYIRISLCSKTEILKQALDRINLLKQTNR